MQEIKKPMRLKPECISCLLKSRLDFAPEDTPVEIRGAMTRQFKMMLEDTGFTNLIFNPCPEMCKAEFQGVKEE